MSTDLVKATLEATAGLSSTAKLVALCEAFGISGKDALEALLEARPSTLREAKRALKFQRQKSSGDGKPAPEIQRNAGNPAKTPEIQRQKSSVSSCAGATKELPSEVVILESNTPPSPSEPARPSGPTPMDALRAFEAYNATALICAIPQAAKLTPDRQKRIIARLREYGLDGWMQALANIEKSSFLTGGSKDGWRADLDFLVQAKSFGKVHDGGYGNGRHRAGPVSIAAVAKRQPWEIEQELQAFAQEFGQ
jgi:hypothetical protein